MIRVRPLYVDPDGTPTSWFDIFEHRTREMIEDRAFLVVRGLPSSILAILDSSTVCPSEFHLSYDAIKSVVLGAFGITYPPSQITAAPAFSNATSADSDRVASSLAGTGSLKGSSSLSSSPTVFSTAVSLTSGTESFTTVQVADTEDLLPYNEAPSYVPHFAPIRTVSLKLKYYTFRTTASVAIFSVTRSHMCTIATPVPHTDNVSLMNSTEHQTHSLTSPADTVNAKSSRIPSAARPVLNSVLLSTVNDNIPIYPDRHKSPSDFRPPLTTHPQARTSKFLSDRYGSHPPRYSPTSRPSATTHPPLSSQYAPRTSAGAIVVPPAL